MRNRLRSPLPVALASATLLSGCGLQVLDPAGDIASRQADLILVATVLMLIVIVPVIALTFWFAWRYRASNRAATYTPDWDHSTQLELVIWGVPLLIIIALGAVTWISTHLLDPARPLDRIAAGRPVPADTKPLEVQVVALDWKWLFVYPTLGIASVNRLVVPSAVPLSLQLSSGSVWNTFFVPRLGGMIYTMPGMSTRLHLMADAPGRYHGQSAHFSGDGFPDMHFEVVAVDAAAFDAWVQAQRRSPDRLDDDAYRRLSAQGTAPVASYGTVAPGLYHRIHTLQLPPGPGPAATPERSARTPAERLRIDAFVCSAS